MSMIRTDERGTTAIVVSAALLLLLGIAAVALDLGAAWNERRQDQTASDLSSVAGGLSYGDNDEIVTQVLANARLNLDSSYSDAEWLTLWQTCSDPDRPPGFTPLTGPSGTTLDCISLNPSFLRVRAPDQLVATSFARVMGFDVLSVDADTIVTLLPTSGATGLLPFAVRGNAGAGEICLDTGTGQIEPPCDGNESGSFGNIAPPLFGNPLLGTEPDCAHQTSANNYVPDSIAMGIDHLIWRFSAGDWAATGWDPSDNTSNNNVDAVANMDECTDTGGDVAEAADGIPLEAVYVDTGNSVKTDSTEGLITGTNFADGFDARLTRSATTRDFDGYDVDNIPLWAHLLPDSDHGIAYCDGDSFDGESDLDVKNQMMRDCLEDYESNGESAQIFDDTILDTPRFGVAPRLWHDNLGSGMSYRPVKDFDLVYLAGIWLDDDNSSPTVFYPDDDDSSSITPQKNNWEIEQVTAYLLLPSMVSQEVQDFYPGFDDDSLDVSIFE